MAVRLLSRSAARAPVPVFAVLGAGARQAVEALRLRREIALVASPRGATVLLVAGGLPQALQHAAAQVHDQLPHPRATVWWAGGDPASVAGAFPAAVTVPVDGDVVAALQRVHRELVTGERDSEPTVLPHDPPSQWKGVGPHGQGGEGMMGGRPYGRPMAMTGPDRDGLELDQLSLRLGPCFPAFPPGLVLDVVLQGDVVQDVSVAANPFADHEPAAAEVDGPLPDGGDPFRRALRESVPIPQLELARASHHLRWTAAALGLHGLHALAVRTLRLAVGLTADALPAVAALRRRLEANRTVRWATRGVGSVTPGQLPDDFTGPALRAAGVARDARLDDPGYSQLDFRPVSSSGGDAWARFRQRLAEAEQSLQLAQRTEAGAPPGTQRQQVESPQGRLTETTVPSRLLLELLPQLLPGMEWGDAVTTISSLDLDLEQEAAGRAREALR